MMNNRKNTFFNDEILRQVRKNNIVNNTELIKAFISPAKKQIAFNCESVQWHKLLHKLLHLVQ